MHATCSEEGATERSLGMLCTKPRAVVSGDSFCSVAAFAKNIGSEEAGCQLLAAEVATFTSLNKVPSCGSSHGQHLTCVEH